MRIREIENADNVKLAVAIRKVLIEMGVPKVGTAYADVELDAMFEAYQEERFTYFVVEQAGKILGGARDNPRSKTNCLYQSVSPLVVASS